EVTEDVSRLIDIDIEKPLDGTVVDFTVVSQMFDDLPVDLIERACMIADRAAELNDDFAPKPVGGISSAERTSGRLEEIRLLSGQPLQHRLRRVNTALHNRSDIPGHHGSALAQQAEHEQSVGVVLLSLRQRRDEFCDPGVRRLPVKLHDDAIILLIDDGRRPTAADHLTKYSVHTLAEFLG